MIHVYKNVSNSELATCIKCGKTVEFTKSCSDRGDCIGYPICTSDKLSIEKVTLVDKENKNMTLKDIEETYEKIKDDEIDSDRLYDKIIREKNMTLGQRIKEYRKKYHMKQREFALLVGASKPAICNYELETSKPRKERKKRILQVLDRDNVAPLQTPVTEIKREIEELRTENEYLHALLLEKDMSEVCDNCKNNESNKHEESAKSIDLQIATQEGYLAGLKAAKEWMEKQK